MNNNIQEDYCSFEVSKLLKEKGFIQPTLCYYFEDGQFKENIIEDTYGYYGDEYTVKYKELLNNWNDNFLTKKNGNRCFGCSKSQEYFETYSSPTHSLAFKWIRENFDKIITIYANASGYCFEIHDSPELGGSHKYDSDFTGTNDSGCWDRFEEATEAAILYTLQNFIVDPFKELKSPKHTIR